MPLAIIFAFAPAFTPLSVKSSLPRIAVYRLAIAPLPTDSPSSHTPGASDAAIGRLDDCNRGYGHVVRRGGMNFSVTAVGVRQYIGAIFSDRRQRPVGIRESWTGKDYGQGRTPDGRQNKQIRK